MSRDDATPFGETAILRSSSDVSGGPHPPPAIAVGARLGPYEIISLLGVGGMGEVYRAYDTRLSRDVAIKTLASTFLDDPDRIARFRREARVLAALNHPNIAAIYGLEKSVAIISCSSWWRAKRLPARFQWHALSNRRGRSRRRSKPPIAKASFTGI